MLYRKKIAVVAILLLKTTVMAGRGPKCHRGKNSNRFKATGKLYVYLICFRGGIAA